MYIYINIYIYVCACIHLYTRGLHDPSVSGPVVSLFQRILCLLVRQLCEMPAHDVEETSLAAKSHDLDAVADGFDHDRKCHMNNETMSQEI